MYPVVVGFNRALIRSLSKVDHVREWRFVRGLAEQIRDEQTHNQLWRNMLAAFGVSHDVIYADFQSYIARFELEELDVMTFAVVKAIRGDVADTNPGCFPDATLPEPVLALYHHMWMAAAYDNVNYWEYFGGQYGMEAIILDVVSTSVLPGVTKHPGLAPSADARRWWSQHARTEHSEAPGRTAEEKHVELARLALNRSSEANSMAERVVSRADDTMLLFLATALWHDFNRDSFPIERYLGSARSRTT